MRGDLWVVLCRLVLRGAGGRTRVRALEGLWVRVCEGVCGPDLSGGALGVGDYRGVRSGAWEEP